MFYAELVDEHGYHGFKILDRGIFFSFEEFIPYRICGWSGTRSTDEQTDRLISKLGGNEHE